jgi:hypothetical protein
MDLFKKAAKVKLRFATSRGDITTEDLFDLPLVGALSLDTLAMASNRKLREMGDDESFVRKATVGSAVNETESLRLEILKVVIKERQDEADVKSAELAKRQRNDKIKDIIARKKDDALDNMDIADLEKLLEE